MMTQNMPCHALPCHDIIHSFILVRSIRFFAHSIFVIVVLKFFSFLFSLICKYNISVIIYFVGWFNGYSLRWVLHIIVLFSIPPSTPSTLKKNKKWWNYNVCNVVKNPIKTDSLKNTISKKRKCSKKIMPQPCLNENTMERHSTCTAISH